MLTNPILGGLQGVSGGEFLNRLIRGGIMLILVVGVIVFLFILFFGAIQWMTAGGDKAAIESARGKLINALIGLFLLFSVYAILKLVETFFGISILGGITIFPI